MGASSRHDSHDPSRLAAAAGNERQRRVPAPLLRALGQGERGHLRPVDLRRIRDHDADAVDQDGLARTRALPAQAPRDQRRRRELPDPQRGQQLRQRAEGAAAGLDLRRLHAPRHAPRGARGAPARAGAGARAVDAPRPGRRVLRASATPCSTASAARSGSKSSCCSCSMRCSRPRRSMRGPSIAWRAPSNSTNECGIRRNGTSSKQSREARDERRPRQRLIARSSAAKAGRPGPSFA